MTKISLSIRVCADDWAAESAIKAVMFVKFCVVLSDIFEILSVRRIVISPRLEFKIT